MVGSLGRLGILYEVTFKVFPEPEAYATLEAGYANLLAARDSLARLNRHNFMLEALDWSPPGRLHIRIGGIADSLAARLARLVEFLETDTKECTGEEEAGFWDEELSFAWSAPSHSLMLILFEWETWRPPS